MVDSNTDPSPIDIVLPANDDAIRSVRLITSGIANAAILGRMERESITGEMSDFSAALAATDNPFASADAEAEASAEAIDRDAE